MGDNRLREQRRANSPSAITSSIASWCRELAPIGPRTPRESYERPIGRKAAARPTSVFPSESSRHEGAPRGCAMGASLARSPPPAAREMAAVGARSASAVSDGILHVD